MSTDPLNRLDGWQKAIQDLPAKKVQRYCLGFAFHPVKGVVLIRKNRPEWQAGKLNGVGGKIEAGESPEQAMAREFEEETGYHTVSSDWMFRGHCVGSDFTIDVFTMVLPQYSIVSTTTDEEIVTQGVYTLGDDVLPHVEALIHCCLMRIGAKEAVPFFTFHY
jgi:NTP pyrophosphohydrolases including oxidative damage repair enzymes